MHPREGGMLLSAGKGMLPPNAPCLLFALHHHARRMRRAPTRSEALLWGALRDRRAGIKVRRQAILGRHIVDFFVASHRLVIEVDGGVHDSPDARAADAAREAALAREYGVRFVRVRAELVERDVRAAVEIIRAAL